MGAKVKTPTQQQIDELRQLFEDKYAQTPPLTPFHAKDLERVRKGETWCRKFLESNELNVNLALEKLWNTCQWRRSYGANDLNETNLRAEYLNDGLIFARNHDVDGKPLLIVSSKQHTRGSRDLDEVLRVLIYWIERLQRETDMDQITLFFDMEGTGISNMDLEFVKRMIEPFKLYYPNAINYILVFEMAWVLNAAFKVIKNLLPEKALEILKVITKKNINEYVKRDCCLRSWGGTDDYVFRFIPERRKEIQPKTNVEPIEAPMQLKKNSGVNHQPTREAISVRLPKRQAIMEAAEMIRVEPVEYLSFSSGDKSEATIHLANVFHIPITYKIQTTSPDKFLVRPRCGIMNPGDTTAINIVLKSDHSLSRDGKDKFLVMCLSAPDVVTSHVAEFWLQHHNQHNIEQHRLTCTYNDSPMKERGRSSSTSGKKSIRKTDSPMALEKQLRYMQILQVITLVFLLMLAAAVIYLLMLQICGEAGCFGQGGVNANDDYFACKKTQRNL